MGVPLGPEIIVIIIIIVTATFLIMEALGM